MDFFVLRRLSHIVDKVFNRLSYSLHVAAGIYKEIPIVDVGDAGNEVCLFKEKTVEHFDFIKAYGFLEGGGYDIDYPEIALWKFVNATAFHSSDLVLTEKNYAVWPKYYYYNYAKNIITDKNVIREKDGILTYKKPRKVIEVKSAFSLIGVFAHIWAHAIVEYYPKLAVLRKAIDDSNDKITVLVPEYKDNQLREVIYAQLEKYDVNILVVNEGDAVKANTLYFMPRPTIFTDHETDITPGDQVFPRTVIDYVKENLVQPYTMNVEVDKNYSKIFLPRRGGIGKGIINQDEIEQIFKDKGFVFVQPHKISLEEKVKIFKSAQMIVGPFGSAFTNLFFCRPGVKVLLFSNYQRVFDYYFSAGQQYFGATMLFVTGKDDKEAPNMSHCSYYLPPEKVIKAAKSIGIFDE